MRVTFATTEDRRRGRETWRGAVDLAPVRWLALDDGESVGDVFRRGGGLHKRRLPNGVIFGGNGDREDARLGDGSGVTVDDGLRLVGGRIS